MIDSVIVPPAWPGLIVGNGGGLHTISESFNMIEAAIILIGVAIIVFVILPLAK